MGILDLTSTVTTKYKADASDNIKELKKLKGEEKERAKELLDQQRQINDSLESHIKTLGKVAVAVGVGVVAYKAASDAINEYANYTKLVSAAGSVDIDRLKTASAGLKTETELLADAARLNHGQIKLTAVQMEIAERAMLSFTRQGKDSAKVNEAILQAVTALKTDGLEDLGIHIDKTGLSMDNASDRGILLKRTFDALTVASRTAGDQALTDAEKYQRASVRMQDAGDRIKRGFGWAASEVGDRIGKNLAIWVKLAHGDTEGASAIANDNGTGNGSTTPGLDFYANMVGSARYARSKSLVRTGVWGDQNASTDLTPDEKLQAAIMRIESWAEKHGGSNLIDTPLTDAQIDALAHAKANVILGHYLRVETGRSGIEVTDPNVIHSVALRAPRTAGAYDTTTGGYEGIFGRDFTQQLGDIANDRLTEKWNDKVHPFETAAQRTSAISKSHLESMFGPIDEFNAYKSAFDTLGGAVGSALNAWIDGSESAGTAVKKFIGQALKGIAVQMAMESLKHGAFALGSLAFGDVPGAAKHGAAAAAFAAGAAAAAIAAKEFGGGSSAKAGGGSGSLGGSAAPANGNASAMPYGGAHVIYVVNDSFGDTSTRMRIATFKRRANEAYGSSGVMQE